MFRFVSVLVCYINNTLLRTCKWNMNSGINRLKSLMFRLKVTDTSGKFLIIVHIYSSHHTQSVAQNTDSIHAQAIANLQIPNPNIRPSLADLALLACYWMTAMGNCWTAFAPAEKVRNPPLTNMYFSDRVSTLVISLMLCFESPLVNPSWSYCAALSMVWCFSFPHWNLRRASLFVGIWFNCWQ